MTWTRDENVFPDLNSDILGRNFNSAAYLGILDDRKVSRPRIYRPGLKFSPNVNHLWKYRSHESKMQSWILSGTVCRIRRRKRFRQSTARVIGNHYVEMNLLDETAKVSQFHVIPVLITCFACTGYFVIRFILDPAMTEHPLAGWDNPGDICSNLDSTKKALRQSKI